MGKVRVESWFMLGFNLYGKVKGKIVNHSFDLPHFMQNLLSSGMDAPQCKQNSLCFTSLDGVSRVFDV